MSDIERKHRRLRSRRVRNIFLNTVCAVLTLAGAWWVFSYFREYMNYEVTNDAYVDQYVATVNVRVAGYIREVRFREHQAVHRGDTLLVLDNREALIRVAEAEAALLDAEGARDVLGSGIEAARTNIDVERANMAEEAARLEQYRQDYERYRRLRDEESVTGQEYERAKAQYEAGLAHYEALRQQHRATTLQHREMLRRGKSAEAAIRRARAALDMARLNLSYTVVTAPYDGVTGRRSIEPGQYVQAGQSVSALVRSRGKWITANYKETQIGSIYVGQPVRVKIDAFPGRTFTGRVTSISEATGSKYALVPTDNSAGNFVKIQQRIPVRIDLENVAPADMQRMRAGMMAETSAVKR